MEKKGLSLEAKHKMANITAVCTVLLTLFFGVLIYKQSDQALPLILGIVRSYTDRSALYSIL